MKIVTAFLEDPESSRSARSYGRFITCFTIFAIVVGLLPEIDVHIPNPYAFWLDLGLDSTLLLEILVRFLFYPSWLAFFHSAFNIIDSLSAVPLVFQLACSLAPDRMGPAGRDFLIVAMPVSRLMRLMRRFSQIQILFTAFKDCVEALPVLLYTMAVLVSFFTSLIFLFEPRTNLPSIGHTAWMVLSTMTTVGYGDVVPVTKMGHALTSALMIASPLFMAMPIGIVGSSFTAIWGNRQRILLLEGTRGRLAKWGFTAYDIPDLFAAFDLNEDSEVGLKEWRNMLKALEIGFKERDAIEIFKCIDLDGSGSINQREFVRTLYPVESMYLYKPTQNSKNPRDSFGRQDSFESNMKTARPGHTVSFDNF